MQNPLTKLRSKPQNPEGTMTVLEHIGELRTRLLRVLLYVALGFVVCFGLFDIVVELVSKPYLKAIDAPKLTLQNPTDAIALKLKVVTYMAIAVAMPFVIWEVWGFVSPGLTRKERRWSLPFIPLTFFFFCLGVWFGYLTLEPAMDFMVGFAGPKFQNLGNANGFFAFWTFLMLAFGLTFEFPLVLVLLMAARALTWRQLLGAWRYAVVGIVVFAAVITPSQDPYSLLLMSVPMVVFYFGAVIFGRIAFNKPRSQAPEQVRPTGE